MSYLAGITTLFNSELLSTGNIIAGEAGCKDIEIRGKYITIQTDHKIFKDNIISSLFKPGAARCICDYVLISDELILVCELKTNNEGQMKTQLKNTAKFVAYLLEMVKEHYNITLQQPQVKYVCFGKMYGEGKRTAIADKLNRIPWQESELFKLSCNATYHLKQFN